MDPTKGNQAPGPDKATGEAAENETDWQKQAAELQKQLEDANKALEAKDVEHGRNVRRLQSSLTSQINEARADLKATEDDWRTRFDNQKMASLSEEDALRYQASRLEEKLAERDEEVQRMREAAQNAQNAASYIRHFTAQGVDPSKLNTQGSLQDLYDSGTAAVEEARGRELLQMQQMQEQLKEYQGKLEKFEQVNPDPNQLAENQGDLRPPNVANVGPGRSDQPRTMYEAREAAKQYFDGNTPSEEQLYRAVETGRLPPQVLPGLESLPKE